MKTLIGCVTIVLLAAAPAGANPFKQKSGSHDSHSDQQNATRAKSVGHDSRSTQQNDRIQQKAEIGKNSGHDSAKQAKLGE